MRALVYGLSSEGMETVPPLLARAGFEVTLIGRNAKNASSDHVTKFLLETTSIAIVDTALAEASKGYDLVVACDDEIIRDVKQSALAVADKLCLLPTTSPAGLAHLGSKIALSRRLQEGGVTTPPFAVASQRDTLLRCCEEVGFPLFLKEDVGGGGTGVREVRSVHDVEAHAGLISYPVLVQKKIEGTIIDLSGFFYNNRPVFFCFAETVEALNGGLGPTSVRLYRKGAMRAPHIIRHISRLGEALFAHGFANITAIWTPADKRFYFIEADMRPNVWIEYPKYLGEDPADWLRRCFAQGDYLNEDVSNPLLLFPDQDAGRMKMAYLPRLGIWDIVLNKYNCRGHYENYLKKRVLRTKIKRTIREFFGGLRTGSGVF